MDRHRDHHRVHYAVFVHRSIRVRLADVRRTQLDQPAVLQDIHRFHYHRDIHRPVGAEYQTELSSVSWHTDASARKPEDILSRARAPHGRRKNGHAGDIDSCTQESGLDARSRTSVLVDVQTPTLTSCHLAVARRFLFGDMRYSVPMSLIDNKRALIEYQVLDTMEAGLELFGFEVKSLRKSLGSLKGARVVARGGEAYLVGATIPPWQQSNAPKTYDPERPRRLLLKMKEIAHISSAESQKGLTIIPISVYNKGSKLKLEVGIVRGKRKQDKRETIKARDEKRNIERTLKNK